MKGMGMKGVGIKGVGMTALFRGLLALALLSVLLLALSGASAAAGESVEVAPGVLVPWTTYPVPIIEQPFFGFEMKSQKQIAADKAFLDYFAQRGISRDDAFAKTIALGWRAMGQGDVNVAARRFNQAHLIKPGHPDVFHGFAVVVHLRFKDQDYAKALFKLGANLPGRSAGYMADYGRFLLTIGMAAEAAVVLDEAVREQPQNATAWSNLAWARFHNGRRTEACEAVARSAGLNPAANIVADLKLLRQRASCEG